jgi:hypothetical protein
MNLFAQTTKRPGFFAALPYYIVFNDDFVIGKRGKMYPIASYHVVGIIILLV